MAVKCRYCVEPAVQSGMCARHAKLNVYRDPRKLKAKAKQRKRTPRKREWPLAHDDRWIGLSGQYLVDFPWCARCLMRPEVAGGSLRRKAVHCDHVWPVARYPEYKYDMSRCQGLCRSCHSVKSAYELKGLYYDYVRGVVYDVRK